MNQINEKQKESQNLLPICVGQQQTKKATQEAEIQTKELCTEKGSKIIINEIIQCQSNNVYYDYLNLYSAYIREARTMTKEQVEQKNLWKNEILSVNNQQLDEIYDCEATQSNSPLWLQRGPDEMYTPNWKKVLYETNNPFINQTIKSIIAQVVELQSSNLATLYDHFIKSPQETHKFFSLLYCTLTLRPDQLLSTIKDVGMQTNVDPGKFVGYLSYVSHFAECSLDWYIKSSPFNYCLGNVDGRQYITHLPQNYYDKLSVITDINRVFNELLLDFLVFMDPNQQKLSDAIQHAPNDIVKNRLMYIKYVSLLPILNAYNKEFFISRSIKNLKDAGVNPKQPYPSS